MFQNENNIVIGTGNVLGVSRKAGQKTTEELMDCLKATLCDQASNSKNGNIYRNNDDLLAKVTEHKRDDIKIGSKLFLNNDSEALLKNAIDNLLETLNITHLDSLILAYHPKLVENGSAPGSGVAKVGTRENGDTTPPIANGGESKEIAFEWANKWALNNLKRMWKVLEEYVDNKKICQLGIADLDTNSLIELFDECLVKPTIVQINLSACCIVPPLLQEFCNKHDIQLLTHSDPQDIITPSQLSELNVPNFIPTWTIRYQVHVKCRGVLAAKGFIIGAERN